MRPRSSVVRESLALPIEPPRISAAQVNQIDVSHLADQESRGAEPLEFLY